jgi:hypothetical protein
MQLLILCSLQGQANRGAAIDYGKVAIRIEDLHGRPGVTAPDRAAVSAAANQIDRQLREDPYANSESRSGSMRVILAPPLGAAYDVNDDDRMVTVWAVWHY